ncbi:MAG: D-2-hydroxyacid dehydrogenase, partial [Proteobacteria bacterium]|nr:D-2-hydroxyacid dehydrogenase [Pseudomonadota bacterium]
DGATLNPGDLSWDGLKEFADIEIYERSNHQQIIERAKDAQALITNKAIINKEAIAQLPKLNYIGVTATGYNIVDVNAAHEKGITVTNIPAYATMSVAQMVFAHILQFTNNVALHSHSVKAGEWVNCPDFSYAKSALTELTGLTLGIIGFGDSGKATAQIAQAFGMNILVYARKKEQLPQGNIKQVDLTELFKSSDFVSLHCPLNEDSKEIINREHLSLMKPQSYVINIGRGGLVNESDLADALRNGKIAGAGVDVLSCEPPKADNPLLKAPNCNITPHIAWATYAARKRAVDIAIDNFISFLKGEIKNSV